MFQTFPLLTLFCIGLFGMTGVFARYFLSFFWNKFFVTSFPCATFMINTLGSFVIGVVYVTSTQRVHMSESLKLGMMVGFLGGFTTFSSYSLETALLFEKGKSLIGLCYFVLSPMVGLCFTFCGIFLTRKLF